MIEDADGTVDAGSVSLSIDGVDSGASASKSGGVTTITAANSGMWSPGQVVSATLTYSAGGIFPLSVLVLDGDQLRDTQPRVDPCGFG